MLGAASTLLTLGVLEIVARRTRPLDPYEVRPESGAATLLVSHPLRGTTLRAGFRGRFVHPEFGGAKVRIDRNGHRVPETEAPARAREARVLLVGDSIAFGLGVGGDETMGALLERELEARLGRHVRVVNAAVPGHGPSQEARVVADEGARAAYDATVMVFYSGNDLHDALAELRRRIVLLDLLEGRWDALVLVQGPAPIGPGAFVVAGVEHPVLFAHAPAELEYTLPRAAAERETVLRVGLALDPKVARNPGADGVEFQVLLRADGSEETLLSERLSPKAAGVHRRRVRIPRRPGGRLVLRTGPGPAGASAFDWSGWASPVLVSTEEDARLESDPLRRGILESGPSARFGRRVDPRSAGSRGWIEERSSLARLLLERADVLRVRWRLVDPPVVATHFLLSTFELPPPPPVTAALAATREALASVADAEGRRANHAVLLLVPAKLQTEPRTQTTVIGGLGSGSRRYDFTRPHGEVREMAESLGMVVVDMLPEAAARVAAGEQLYFGEGHLDPSGHALAARLLVEPVAAAIAHE